MKKFHFVVFLFLASVSFAQTNYPGNGKTGFGGPVGTGSLTVSDNGSAITFILNKGSNDLNDAVVLYIDSKDGGFTTTSGFLDAADGLRRAIQASMAQTVQHSPFRWVLHRILLLPLNRVLPGFGH